MKYKHLSKDERNELAILLEKDYSLRDIAKVLKRNPSTISREIKKRKTKEKYDPIQAQRKYQIKRSNSKFCGMKINDNQELKTYLKEKLKIHWSPEQIAGRWNKENEKEKITSVSIYKYLYSNLGQELCKYLKSKRYYKKKRKNSLKSKKILIPDRTPIEKRIILKNEFGHFEGDTLGRIKTDQNAIAGVVEKLSRFVFFVKVPKLKYTIEGFDKVLNSYQNIVKSFTLNNGVENVRYQELNVPTFFCNPYHSWEKGLIENSFQRLRRFIPKKSSLKKFSSKDIQKFQNFMNDTPRKCLDFATPREVFDQKVREVNQCF